MMSLSVYMRSKIPLANISLIFQGFRGSASGAIGMKRYE